MILFIDGIITPYQIARYNLLNKNLNKPILVWFQDHTENFRGTNNTNNISFKYKVLDLFKINFLGTDFLTLRINKRIIKELNLIKKDIDRIVITGWDQPICLVACLWAKKNGIKVTLRSGSTINEDSFLRSITKPYVKWFVKLFDDYISYGTASSKYLSLLGAQEKKIFKFFNTVDINFFANQSNSRKKEKQILKKLLKIRENEFVILSSGRFVKLKQFSYLINVFKKFHMKHPKSKLIIMGDGPEFDNCKKEAGNLLNRKIFLPGLISHEQISDYYLVSSIFVLPSNREVWGLVVNEALACSLPALVSNVAGCTQDLIIEGKTGYTFNSNSKNDLLNKLEKVYNVFLNESNFLALKKACQNHIKKFTINKNIQKLNIFWGI